VFEFTIRILRAPDKTREAPHRSSSLTNGSEKTRPVRILVCEDNPVNRTLAERILTKSGYLTGSASNGAEAIELFHQEEWDLVLMDVQMPGLDGVTATSRLRQECDRGKTTPIVALTAHATKADRDRCLSAGMDGYVAKPFSPEDLLTAVELHLELGRSPRTTLVSHDETGD
jgi:two-component system, sensor histidine kinase and response regulator